MIRIKSLLSGLLALSLAACVTPVKIAFNETTESLDTSEQSVVIASARINNAFKPTKQINTAMALPIYTPDQNLDGVAAFHLALKKEEFSSTDKGAEGLFRAAIPPGDYIIGSLNGSYVGALILAVSRLPLKQSITIPPNAIIHLGHIDATIRERKDNEFRAGALTPLIDQAVAGFSTGTYDANIRQASEADIAALKAKYPVLANKEIRTIALPAFDRSKFDK